MKGHIGSLRTLPGASLRIFRPLRAPSRPSPARPAPTRGAPYSLCSAGRASASEGLDVAASTGGSRLALGGRSSSPRRAGCSPRSRARPRVGPAARRHGTARRKPHGTAGRATRHATAISCGWSTWRPTHPRPGHLSVAPPPPPFAPERGPRWPPRWDPVTQPASPSPFPRHLGARLSSATQAPQAGPDGLQEETFVPNSLLSTRYSHIELPFKVQ